MKVQIPWIRVLVEGVVIVVSILLAFGIDAFWDGRQERRAESEVLAQIEAELAQVDSVLAQFQANHARKAERLRVLLSHTGPGRVETLSSDSLAMLFMPLRVGWVVDLPLATLTALESSGRINIISDHAILRQISAFRALTDDLEQDERELSAITMNQVLPYLSEHVALVTVSTRSRAFASPTPSEFPDGLRAVLGHREFESLIDEVRFRTDTIVRNYDWVDEALEQLRSMITAALQE